MSKDNRGTTKSAEVGHLPTPDNQNATLKNTQLKMTLEIGACAICIFIVHSVLFYILFFFPLKTLIISISALVFSLISFHILFFVRRNKFNQDTLRIIDYIYLGIGTLSLLGALQVDRTITDERLEPIVQSQKLADLGVMNSLKIALATNCKAPENPWISLSCTYASQQLDLYNMYRAAGRTDDLTKIYANDTHNRMINTVSASATEAMGEFVKYSRMLDDSYTWLNIRIGNFRGLAFILLMEAVALRIARVTVELQHWFKA